MKNIARIGITIGDFNGVGPELILKTFSNNLVYKYCTPVVYGTSYILSHYAKLLEIPMPDVNIVKHPKDIKDGMLNIRQCSNERIDIIPGTPSKEAGALALSALELAVADIKEGLIENILTAPIDKNTTVEAGLKHNGHTGFFAHEFESAVQMILLSEEQKVAMVTGHTALKDVSANLSAEDILHTIERFENSLKADFAITKPRIAVLGMNPHGGDNGLMGSEEKDIILPAIEKAQENGSMVIGPYPPDGFFGSKTSQQFDGVIGMYHDQVLIPFKQIAFADGINYTAGLPIIRTSPDHGTAYDIAGKGTVDTSSFINALYLINKIHRNRLAYYDQSVSPLPFKEHRREKFSIGVPNLR